MFNGAMWIITNFHDFSPRMHAHCKTLWELKQCGMTTSSDTQWSQRVLLFVLMHSKIHIWDQTIAKQTPGAHWGTTTPTESTKTCPMSSANSSNHNRRDSKATRAHQIISICYSWTRVAKTRSLGWPMVWTNSLSRSILERKGHVEFSLKKHEVAEGGGISIVNAWC